MSAISAHFTDDVEEGHGIYEKHVHKWKYVEKDMEGRTHCMCRWVQGSKRYVCIQCGKRSKFSDLLGTCRGQKWFIEKERSCKE